LKSNRFRLFQVTRHVIKFHLFSYQFCLCSHAPSRCFHFFFKSAINTLFSCTLFSVRPLPQEEFSSFRRSHTALFLLHICVLSNYVSRLIGLTQRPSSEPWWWRRSRRRAESIYLTAIIRTEYTLCTIPMLVQIALVFPTTRRSSGWRSWSKILRDIQVALGHITSEAKAKSSHNKTIPTQIMHPRLLSPNRKVVART